MARPRFWRWRIEASVRFGCEVREELQARAGAEKAGASEGIRTLDINLGKVTLYQLSYTRI